MKKVLALVLALLMMFSLVACAAVMKRAKSRNR